MGGNTLNVLFPSSYKRRRKRESGGGVVLFFDILWRRENEANFADFKFVEAAILLN
jgi:hypothetical protein